MFSNFFDKLWKGFIDWSIVYENKHGNGKTLDPSNQGARKFLKIKEIFHQIILEHDNGRRPLMEDNLW